jgi:hypothetical protein
MSKANWWEDDAPRAEYDDEGGTDSWVDAWRNLERDRLADVDERAERDQWDALADLLVRGELSLPGPSAWDDLDDLDEPDDLDGLDDVDPLNGENEQSGEELDDVDDWDQLDEWDDLEDFEDFEDSEELMDLDEGPRLDRAAPTPPPAEAAPAWPLFTSAELDATCTTLARTASTVGLLAYSLAHPDARTLPPGADATAGPASVHHSPRCTACSSRSTSSMPRLMGCWCCWG